jgi:hypothetical protein
MANENASWGLPVSRAELQTDGNMRHRSRTFRTDRPELESYARSAAMKGSRVQWDA